MEANTLFLRLEGPLQSWGERARWSERDTALEPTKSGVVGLLACALGWSEDADLRRLSRAIHLAVRCDRPGVLLEDYHTVVGGVLSAEGKVKRNVNTKEPETVVTHRAYLCDASFLVVIQATPEWITRLAAAVQNPVWPYYLGRKSCVPAVPVFLDTGFFERLEDTLQIDRIDAHPLWVVTESDPEHGIMHRDEILSNRRRTFLPRYTRKYLLPGGTEGGE